MDSTIRRASQSTYVVIGPEGATNFVIIKGATGRAVLIDADIRRIDEVEEALNLAGCLGVEYLINTHEHFDHTSASFYFRFKKMHDYLEDFYANLQEIKSGRKDRDQVARYMQSGAYAPLGKTRMVERNINQFLTGNRY